ncbi:hypothetical protein ACN47E_002699 [Coniothyrium glycines]
MRFSTTLFAIATAATLAVAAPTPQQDTAATAATAAAAAAAAAAASRKNVYLSTCTTRGLLGLLSSTSSVAIYYNGPANSRTSPTDTSDVSSTRAVPWEGYTRRTTLSGRRFSSDIDADAGSLSMSQIAGSGTLGEEVLICFVDGSTRFRFQEGLLGLRETECVADYWCASIGN